jgi:mRNA-degrading endonuclease toxin of MazEF toxin-antitoxin module
MVALNCEGKAAVAVVDQIRAVSKDRLDKWMGAVSREELAEVEEALRTILEL